MLYETMQAKDGSPIIKVNNVSIYSKYRPFEEAEKFIRQEIDYSKNIYFLLGLGFGYHLKALQQLIGERPVKIVVFGLDQQENRLFKASPYYHELINDNRIQIQFALEDVRISDEMQFILPQSWINAIPKEHPLYFPFINIKMKQRSFNTNKHLMSENFKLNVARKDFGLVKYSKTIQSQKVACLIASGPSLEKTYTYLISQREKLYILCVGSALRVLLNYGIVPDAVVIMDPQQITINQLIDVEYQGPLFYLSTAYHETTRLLKGERYILFQKGYDQAEMMAEQLQHPLIETGGSVATVGLSLLEWLKFKEIVLFGQDLGFKENNTHVRGSTSGRVYEDMVELLTIPSNNGGSIFTEKGLYGFLKWFEYKATCCSAKIYNTAFDGAEIKNIPYISLEEFNQLILMKENLKE